MSRNASPRTPRLLLPALVALSLTGCATKEFVQQEVALVNKRIAGLEGLLDQAGQRINANVARIQASEGRLGKAEADAAALNGRLDQTQVDLAGATRNLAGLQVGLNEASQRIDVHAVEIAAAQQRLGTVEQRLGAASQRVEGAMVSLAQADARLAALEAVKAAGTGTEPAAPAASAETPPQPPTPSAAPAPGQATVGLQERLARVGVLIDEVHRRINVNTSTLQSASLRIGALETGLAAAGKRGEESDAALKAAQEGIVAVQGQLAGAGQRIDANTHALEQMGRHIDAAKGGLQTANTRLDEAEKRLGELGAKLARNDAADAEVSATAKEALERALAAGKLAEGKLLAETVLTEEVGFGLERTRLSDEARQALATFAERLKAENQGVFIEIQGHTDNTGSTETNLRLSRQRAEAVRDYLHLEAGLPLHRLTVAAYGEARPVADNKTREGRIKNRRVVLVVLK